AFPANAGSEVDHRSRLGTLCKAVARSNHALLRALAEDVARRHAELRDDGIQRADRRIDAVELDLRDEARRHSNPACELAESDSEALSLGAKSLYQHCAGESPL